MTIAVAVTVLLCGIALSVLNRKVSLFFESTARRLVGDGASVWEMRITAYALMLLVAAVLLGLLFGLT